MLHVAQVSFYMDPYGRAPLELLRVWPTLVDVAEAACSAGARVSVVQVSGVNMRLAQRGVDYHFIAPDRSGGKVCEGERFRALLRELHPDVLHVHGLAVSEELPALAALLGDRVPILIQDHANRVPRWWRRGAWRKGLAAAAAVAFCAREQAAPFQQARLFGRRTQIHAVPESTSRFSPGDQDAARSATGMGGNPCLLWVGHLNTNKDPLTVLSGIAGAAEQLPDLQLWCYYGTAPLLAAVQRRIAADPRTRSRVHLMGSAGHDQIERAMRAADLFVLGSHREGSGYSLLEAMACGLPPVVTDIPSFRALTGNGAVGRLWPCGAAAELARAVVLQARQSPVPARHSVRAHFERELSLRAVGRKLMTSYQAMLP